MKTTSLLLVLCILYLVVCLAQCKKKATIDDKILFDKAKSTAGFKYYKNSLAYLPKSSASGHGHSFFRVRFNSVALAALTDNGKLPAGGSFPDGSLVVKEICDTQTGDLQALAVMEKSTGNSSAGVNWLWAEYYPDGTLGYSLSTRGSACISCHGAMGNRDYLRMFELFP